MKFKSPKQILCEELLKKGIKSPKFLFNPGKGDFLNRSACRILKGEWGIIKSGEFGEKIKPGKVIGTCNGVEFLRFNGEEEADSAIVRRKGTVSFEGVSLKYPDFGVDFSLFDELLPSERKSLAVQIEIAYGVIRDFFTPENFFVFSVSPEAEEFLKAFFKPEVPFRVERQIPHYPNVIVLDPNAEVEFSHEEVDENTLIVVGGIVDSSQRLKGSTRRILPEVKHRRISYKGVVSVVPDRVNEIVKIVARYLTSEKELWEVVRENLTRDSKLRFLREFLEESLVRFYVNGELIRGLPEDKYLWLKREFDIGEFLFKKAAKHVSGFVVFKKSLFGKVKGETVRRKKKVFIVEELSDGDVVEKYS